jgi:foldase protein PrsA
MPGMKSLGLAIGVFIFSGAAFAQDAGKNTDDGVGGAVVTQTAVAPAPAGATGAATDVKPAAAGQAAASDKAAAIVDGETISRDELVSAVMAASGSRVLELLIVEKLVEQEAKRRNITCTEAEFDQRLRSGTEARMREFAQQYSREHGFRINEFERQWTASGGSMEDMHKQIQEDIRPHVKYNVLLDKIARSEVEGSITEEAVKTEFNRQYGPKARIRDVVTATKDDAEKVLDRLRAGANIIQLVRECTVDPVGAAKDGVVILPNEGMLATAAFKMMPGQFSPVINVDEKYHVFALEALLPAENVTYDQVKDKVRDGLVQDKADEKTPEIVDRLVSKAKIVRMLKQQ